MNLEIDFFEYCFLLEACIPPRPIARTMFFIESIDTHYKKMNNEERKNCYEWIKRAINENYHRDEQSNRLIDKWLARYNPANQYLINNEIECFKYQDQYHVKINTAVNSDLITAIKQVEK